MPFRRVAVLLALPLLVGSASSDEPPAPRFDYRDLRRFAEATASIDGGQQSPRSAFAAYLAGAGPGLRAWRKRYGVTADGLARADSLVPRYLRYLGGLEPALRSREAEIAAAQTRLHRLASDALDRDLPLPPTSYFVTPLGGGGSASREVLMIGVDYYGRNADAPLQEFTRGIFPLGRTPLQSLDGLVVATAHELVHRYQQMAMGPLDYTRMYRWRRHNTLRARAVREGCAEFLAELAVGYATPDQVEFGSRHERELWLAFRAIADEHTDEHPGWFSGRNAQFPDAPWQIGYFVGARMCRAYYESHENKRVALRRVLRAHSEEVQLAMIAAYDAQLNQAQRP